MEYLKKILVIAIVVWFSIGEIFAQNVGINEPNPDNSALIEMTSTDKGLLVPRMTETERDAIASPAEGLIIYNLDDTCLNLYRYNYWYNMCCCDAASSQTISLCGNPTIIIDVTNPSTGDTWMDRNLGASQQATAYNDYQAYGALFQWGRLNDGHECITWTNSTTGTPDNGTTSTNSSTDDPGHSNYILEPNSPYDWRVPQNDNLWQGISGTNNPCPSGYRLPTETELENERLSWSSNDCYGAYDSPLKLVVAGYRNYNGALTTTGSTGFYWSSSVDGINVRSLFFLSSNADMGPDRRARGFSVRCIKD